MFYEGLVRDIERVCVLRGIFFIFDLEFVREKSIVAAEDVANHLALASVKEAADQSGILGHASTQAIDRRFTCVDNLLGVEFDIKERYDASGDEAERRQRRRQKKTLHNAYSSLLLWVFALRAGSTPRTPRSGPKNQGDAYIRRL
ncbi:hypothetical protein L596_025651 [Steinernema carpocapsae]|uniref:Uncharacterized protein n=1 Tax=Steinernema carpocapsae TaxID=34508 RepID=A0A4U5M8E9_STECR|nr:hypothetical protein L596_025651 [Steinernema carpocapsae]